MKSGLILIFLSFTGFLSAQNTNEDSILVRLQEYEEFTIPRNYQSEYRIALRRVRRVYPLALYAAKVIDSLEQEIASTDKTRKQKKIARQTHRDLKEDFKFLLRELYVSEGIVLSKLIHRETGMTVEQIIAKYKGDAQAKLYKGMASMFDQELDATYDKNHDDFVIECVVQDIMSGKVEFDPTFEIVDREHYRQDRKEYKEAIRESKKNRRERKRQARKAKRNQTDDAIVKNDK